MGAEHVKTVRDAQHMLKSYKYVQTYMHKHVPMHDTYTIANDNCRSLQNIIAKVGMHIQLAKNPRIRTHSRIALMHTRTIYRILNELYRDG